LMPFAGMIEGVFASILPSKTVEMCVAGIQLIANVLTRYLRDRVTALTKLNAKLKSNMFSTILSRGLM
jgi:hypothetical protein